MSKTYTLEVNSNIELKLNSLDIANTDIIKISNTKYHVIDKNKSIIADITKADFNSKSYEVKVNNNTYNININNELHQLIKDMGFTIGKSKLINEIKAPMPGLILDINIKVGQDIKENDTLLVLEAMKMENIITSPRDGIIKTISAVKGNAVEKNELLIEFE
ncbi:acetyl-CoA carboxylase biotin carboxyl carrier protein subunit [Pontimicrobium aquaticum]|uniref:Acetyl-CoA carboxylase biotin carboxyl carrier protein subunit n=1 Tax=Pontimicrobium aquaticum TaxID=2565367 RepID=A0A4U0ER05_9FLAO|nr:acetyl-CoA carboxylase biotin carboxyl carrier protein subunit [Pontimicrobium aquaticum]TJY34081.1 acetyl-CoA carboxylase biotin carboxyl carrier protein subunit [Pontimicrobium aquaticum]